MDFTFHNFTLFYLLKLIIKIDISFFTTLKLGLQGSKIQFIFGPTICTHLFSLTKASHNKGCVTMALPFIETQIFHHAKI